MKLKCYGSKLGVRIWVSVQVGVRIRGVRVRVSNSVRLRLG